MIEIHAIDRQKEWKKKKAEDKSCFNIILMGLLSHSDF